MSQSRIQFGLVALLSLCAAGCSFQAGVNPTYFQYAPRDYDSKIYGLGAVEMSKAVQDEVFTGKPTSFTGGGTTLTLPIGGVIREAATLAFKDVFTQGVKLVETTPNQQDYVAIVRPRLTQFSYEYNQLKNAGFAITPTTIINLSVTLMDSSGQAVWEKKFDSGSFEGSTYFLSGSPGEEISKTAHQAMMKLMQEAADEVQRNLKNNPPAPSKGEKAL